MNWAIREKFKDINLSELLIGTEDVELVESNNWNDTFWGVCNGKGKNHLGKILMEVREELKFKNQKPEFFGVSEHFELLNENLS